jgi:hypothetical protein
MPASEAREFVRRLKSKGPWFPIIRSSIADACNEKIGIQGVLAFRLPNTSLPKRANLD